MKKSGFKTSLPYLILFVLFAALPLFLNSRSWVDLFITIVINMVCAVSLRMILLSGNLSFAQGAFIGVGAYTAGMLALNLGLPMWVTIPLGGIVAAIIGLITGWPFARLKSVYFSMGTMFMGQAIVLFISSWKLAGGALGLNRIPSLATALKGVAETVSLKNYQAAYYVIFLLAIVSLLVMYRVEHSRIGTTLRALSQSEEVAASIGVNPTYYRLLAVGIACFFAGLMGGVQAHYLTAISYSSYSMNMTLWLIMYMMIGGSGKFIGPLVGAILISIVQGIANLLTSISGSSNSAGFIAFSRWVGENSAYTPFLTAAVLLVVGVIRVPVRQRFHEVLMQEELSSFLVNFPVLNLILLLVMCALMLAMIIFLKAQLRHKIMILSLILAAYALRCALGFSPTVFASGVRTCILSQSLFIMTGFLALYCSAVSRNKALILLMIFALYNFEKFLFPLFFNVV